jgi:hypothetical protein
MVNFNNTNKTMENIKSYEQFINESTEQDYIVTYYTIKNDNDISWDVEVTAKSPNDAIAKAKSNKDVPRNARAFNAELKEK